MPWETYIDEFGRLSVPPEAWEAMGIHPGELVSVELMDGVLLIRQLALSCIICDGEEDIVRVKGRPICGGCRRDIAAM